MNIGPNRYDAHLDMENETNKDVLVAPGGNYALNFARIPYSVTAQDSRTGEALPWVKLGKKKNGTALVFPIEFRTEGIEDGRSLNATLTFIAAASNNNATPATPSTVELSAVLESVPSLMKSIMTINGNTGSTLEITEGAEVRIEIMAKDLDGLPIKQSRGRFFEVSWQLGTDGRPQTQEASFNLKSSCFFLKLTSLELSKAGEYRYESLHVCMYASASRRAACRIWISKVFGHDIIAHSQALLLPTSKDHARIVTVNPSLTTKIVGGVLGAVSVIALGGVVRFVKRHPGKLSVSQTCLACCPGVFRTTYAGAAGVIPDARSTLGRGCSYGSARLHFGFARLSKSAGSGLGS